MAHSQFKAGYGSRRRWRSRSLQGSRLDSHDFLVEPLEERRLLSANSSLLLSALATPDLTLDTLSDVSTSAETDTTSLATNDSGPVAEPAVIDVSGTATTTAAGLLDYGGPGDPTLPGFNNVGKGSTGNSTVVYLGNGWVLTAAHVTINNQYGPIRFADQTFQVDMSTIRVLTNPNGTNADLKVFRLTTDPGLPSILAGYLATQAPNWNDQVFLIGNGYTPGVEKFWRVSTATNPWTWTEQAAPNNPGPTDVAGWTLNSTRAIRWGDNRVEQTSMFLSSGGGNYIQAFTTEFDDPQYTSTSAQPYEAQATSGDSGGAVFRYENGRWVLAGIIISVSPTINGQPANTALYGTLTFMADISFYRSEILTATLTSSVVGRHLFYNQSVFDGQTAGASASDDLAIAPDKVAYLPGTGTASFDNISSYTRGLNGIMVDIAGPHGPITADDFSFKIGDNNSPETWLDAPAPELVIVRAGAGLSGSDRVEIIWSSADSPKDTWLQVTVRGNDAAGNFNTDTGLTTSDVFYFGSKLGDSGSGTPIAAITSSADEIAARNNTGAGASLLNLYDFDRNGVVLSADVVAARNNSGSIVKLNLTVAAAAPTVDSLASEASLPAMHPVLDSPTVGLTRPRKPPAAAQNAAVDSVFHQLYEFLQLKARNRTGF